MKKIFVTLLFLCSLGYGNAQQFADKEFYLVDSLDLSKVNEYNKHLLDSALTIYHSQSEDSDKLKTLLNDIVLEYYGFGKQLYVSYLYQASKEKLKEKDLSEKDQKRYHAFLAYTSYFSAVYLSYADDLEEKDKFYQEAIKYGELGDVQNVRFSSLNQLAARKSEIGKMDEAIDDFQFIMSEAKRLDMTMVIIQAQNGIQNIHTAQGKHEKALNDAKNIYAIVIENMKVGNMNEQTLPDVHFSLGYCFLATEQLDSAMHHLNIALEIQSKYGDLDQRWRILFGMGDVLVAKKEWHQGVIIMEEALKLILASDAKTDIALTKSLLARHLYEDGKKERALLLGEEASIEVRENGFFEDVLDVAENLSEMYKQDKNWEKALEFQGLMHAMRDSIRQEKNEYEIATKEAEFKYKEQKILDDQENEKNLALERQAKTQKQYIIYVAVAGILLLAVALIIIIGRLRITRNQKGIIEQQADQLRALDGTKTKFFNNVAHELRTPLTLMNGHLESMLTDRFGGVNENQRKSLLIAKNNTNRLIEMVSEILDLGKLESDKMELNSKSILLKPFLDRIFFTFESLAYQFDINITFEYDLDESVALKLDQNKIEKALNNLIHNALKFTNRGGTVKLRVLKVGEHIVMEISDSGRGIRKEEMNKVFDRYFQTEDKSAPAQGGTGIGLAIAREFVELHKGTINVDSKIDEGSTFTIALPSSLSVQMDTDQQAVTLPSSEIQAPIYPVLDKKDRVILVVEDHKEMQQYIKDLLVEHAKVLIANDGVEALEILEKNKVDLMTIDVMMPNMDGFSLLKRIRKNPNYAKLPTIMLSARAAEEDKVEALEIGVNDYITKPFSQLELVARVANLIENKLSRLEEENEQVGSETEDNIFIEGLKKIIMANLDNSDFTVTQLSEEINLSEYQLNKNIKRVTGLTSLKFIREIKLLHAYEQLRSKKIKSVAEVSYAIGIENPSHFTKLFTERFGKNPSEYLM